jgi:hypothetical protein
LFYIYILFKLLKKLVLLKLDDLEKIETESYAIATEKYAQFIGACQKQGWSLAYTQFSANQLRYSFEKYE